MKINFLTRLYKRYLNSRFRTTRFFRSMQKIFSYSEREKVLKTCLEFVSFNKVKGDYLEFGVFEGDNFIKAILFSRNKDLENMKFFAFDSFEGLPNISGLDKKVEIFSKNQFSCNVNKFRNILQKKKIDLNKIEIIEGWFNKTLNQKLKRKLNIKKASVIFVDVDLYESCVPVMDFITDYIQDGTIIIFDDYFCYKGSNKLGVRKAFEDWLKKNKNITVTPYLQYDWMGKAFILHKK